jgi:spore maturation protein CgeB
MRGLGFERIHYLPLGTDETLFRPSDAPASGDVAVGFVGDSMNRAVAKYAARIPSWPKAARQVDEAARRLIDQTGLTPHGAIAADGLARRPEIRSLDPAGRLDLEALVTWRATQMYRLRMIRALAEFRPVVVGDEGWRDHLDDRFRPRPPVDYYQELPDFYRTCRVNFNATSLQMKGGVNQRLFDVPACGGFLITDRRAQAEALFESGREMICYDHPDQARQMVRYYLTHERERLSVARRARDRVLAEHTYVHRVRRMIDCMRRDHGRPARRR